MIPRSACRVKVAWARGTGFLRRVPAGVARGRASGRPEICALCLMLALGTALTLVSGEARAAAPRGNTAEELEIGRGVVREIDQAVRVSTDTLAVARLDSIARHIAPRTERPLIEYEVKIIEAPVSNAFSIPGGFLYFTDALVKEARSDDELAGVMAHEIAHNTRQHALNRMKRGSTQVMKLADLISLGIFILTGGGEWGQAARLGVGAVTQSVMSGYSIEDEKDADARAIEYLAGSEYNPTGFLTFMERQATLQNQMAEEVMGFYRTHPFSGDRVLTARRDMEKRGLPIQRRAVGAAPVAVLGMVAPAARAVGPSPGHVNEPPAAADSSRVPAVLIEGDVLYYLGAADTSEAAARRNVEELNVILDLPSGSEEIRVEEDPAAGSARIVAGEHVVELSAADGRANGVAAGDLARRLRERVLQLTEVERRRVALLYYLIGDEREPH